MPKCMHAESDLMHVEDQWKRQADEALALELTACLYVQESNETETAALVALEQA